MNKKALLLATVLLLATSSAVYAEKDNSKDTKSHIKIQMKKDHGNRESKQETNEEGDDQATPSSQKVRPASENGQRAIQEVALPSGNPTQPSFQSGIGSSSDDEDTGEDAPIRTPFEVTGTISSMEGTSIVVNGQTIILDPSVVSLEINGVLNTGVTVKVVGVTIDGVMYAKEITSENTDTDQVKLQIKQNGNSDNFKVRFQGAFDQLLTLIQQFFANLGNLKISL